MADKTLRELYFDVLAAIYDTTEIELTEVELGKGSATVSGTRIVYEE